MNIPQFFFTRLLGGHWVGFKFSIMNKAVMNITV